MILEIVAIAISLISLVVALLQSLALKKTLDNQIYESFVSNSLEIDRMLIEHPEIRKYIYYGEPIDENTPDLNRIMSVIEFVVDAVENIEVYEKYIPKSRRDGWLKFVYDVTHTPAYEYYSKKHGKWYEVK
ncbi:MAG: hypothetical protein IJU41_03985 [Clostridia bacterium]|nr:hypothetical protein [Clostridia bacterium]